MPSATPFFARQVKAGVYRELDLSKIPNAANLDPALMKIVADGADPENRHGLIYLWGTNGLGYNEDQIKAALPDAPLGSLDLLLKPEVVSHFKDCGVAVLDSAEEIYPVVLKYLGYDPNTEDRDALAAATQRLKEIRPYIRYFNSQQYIDDLANGKICLAFGYSGDIIIARTRVPGRPRSICGVVYEGSHRKTGCQFSFTCDGISDRIRDWGSWREAQKIAANVMRTGGKDNPVAGGATFYHADYVSPRWASRMVKVAEIGTHIFYRPPPGRNL